ncbi:MAG: hypothetical protein Q4B61_03280 [Bacteroidales bacterium]|nr:hypothetical protein [Bacteroidales bacterium]
MIKRLITTLSLICLALGAYAEAKYMTIEMVNGSRISFLLADNPVITYQNGSLVVNNDTKTTYSFDDVKNYHFTESNDSGVDALNANELRLVWIDNETIEVQNGQPNSGIVITAINGVMASQTKTDAEGKATVKIPSNAGVYIITVGRQSFKFIRKN